MRKLQRLMMALLAFIIAVGGTGLVFQPAQAAACSYYHTVFHGQSLSWIGRYYGVNWKSIANANGLTWPYVIVPGQVLCIPGGGYYPPYPGPVDKGWSFAVVNVQKDVDVTIRTSNMPSNVLFDVLVGKSTGGSYDWRDVGDLDSGKGGRFKATFGIPADFAGVPTLVVRLVQAKKNTTVDRWFSNIPGGSGTGGLDPWYPWWYGGIPTIWIASVVRDSTVTVTTYNFPPNLNFDVLMGPMGSKGIGGYYVQTFNSGAGGSMVLTVPIPVQLYGSYRIAIRTQNLGTGYYSYNWFYNNTAVAP